MSRRIPFEMAEPGTDPTRIPNSVSRRSLRLGDYWIVLVVIGFLALGYMRFVRKPSPKATETARPVPTVLPTMTPTPGDGGASVGSGFFGGDVDNRAANFARGFFPIDNTPTPTPTPTPVSTATHTPEPEGDGAVVYGVWIGENAIDREQIICWCYPDGTINGPPECGEAVPMACGGGNE